MTSVIFLSKTPWQLFSWTKFSTKIIYCRDVKQALTPRPAPAPKPTEISIPSVFPLARPKVQIFAKPKVGPNPRSTSVMTAVQVRSSKVPVAGMEMRRSQEKISTEIEMGQCCM
jgi:hypothetical protein